MGQRFWQGFVALSVVALFSGPLACQPPGGGEAPHKKTEIPALAKARDDTTDDPQKVIAEVRDYLKGSKDKFAKGSDEYYARLALEQASIACSEKNYGVGAVVVLASGKKLYEFRARNAMVTGLGIADHAESRAITNAYCWAGRNKLLGRDIPAAELERGGKIDPDDTYARDLNEHTKKLVDGVHCFGTLEACPMCTSMILNGGLKTSVSTVIDGDLIEKNGFKLSSGGANSLGEKSKTMPQVWQWISEGQTKNGLRLEQLKTDDKQLSDLSWRIFSQTREYIDSQLRKK